MLEKELIFPPRNEQEQNIIFNCCEPVVIIGANGSGKSKLGFWIEQNQLQPEKVHRISAQRALNFSEYTPQKSLEQANNELYYGVVDWEHWGNVTNAKKQHRWQNHQKPLLSVSHLLNDFDKVLSVLFAKKAQRDSQLVQRVRQMEREGKNELPKIPESPNDILIRIWDDLLPHRKLVIEDGKINVSIVADKTIYSGQEMSDGERVTLYLMAQCLCVPSDSIVIIDEPEIHLHRSLMSKLWSKLEEAQPDCLFIYITHDINFAASRVGAKKIWVKSYDGKEWNWDEVPEEENLPEPILLEILGSRKKILFVEGEKDSWDYKLYQAIYPDFFIIPRGGCDKVIESTKAMRNNNALHHVEAFGIIDIDYRGLEEIETLKNSNIYSLNVAEIENLLCVPELLRIVASHLSQDQEEVEKKVIAFVISHLEQNLKQQASRRSGVEIEFRLQKFDKKSKNIDDLKNSFHLLTKIDIDEICLKNLSLYQNIVDNRDYKKALLYYNNKGISKMISQFFELSNTGYGNLIIRLLSTEHKKDIVSALDQYTPKLLLKQDKA